MQLVSAPDSQLLAEHTGALAGDAHCSSTASSMPQLRMCRLARGSKHKRRAARCCQCCCPCQLTQVTLASPAACCWRQWCPQHCRAVVPCATSLLASSGVVLQAACCSLLPHSSSARAFTLVMHPAADATRRCRQPREAPCSLQAAAECLAKRRGGVLQTAPGRGAERRAAPARPSGARCANAGLLRRQAQSAHAAGVAGAVRCPRARRGARTCGGC